MPQTSKGRSAIANTPASEMPLSALLSKVLVAFIIEFDNEFERVVPHWTTVSRQAGNSVSGTWLVSMAGWYFLQLVGEGVTAGELWQMAGAPVLPVNHMERWGYVRVGPNPSDSRAKTLKRDWLIRPTVKGNAAREMGLPLFGMIQARWRERFGGEVVDACHRRSAEVVARLEAELPHFLPVLAYGLFTEIHKDKARGNSAPRQSRVNPEFAASLPSLLSKLLVAIAVDFEKDWPISLPVAANVLRVLTEQGVAMRDLPHRSGVSREAVAFATGWLLKGELIEYAVNSAEPRKKLLRLTEKGRVAQLACIDRLGSVEKDFESRIGAVEIAALRSSLQAILECRKEDRSVLGSGLIPAPHGWRASKQYISQTLEVVRDPLQALPQYPMVLHRGGYPDGS